MTDKPEEPTFYRGFKIEVPHYSDRTEEAPIFQYDDNGDFVRDADGEPVILGYKLRRQVLCLVSARPLEPDAIKHCGGYIKIGSFVGLVPERYDARDEEELQVSRKMLMRQMERAIDRVWKMSGGEIADEFSVYPTIAE